MYSYAQSPLAKNRSAHKGYYDYTVCLHLLLTIQVPFIP